MYYDRTGIEWKKFCTYYSAGVLSAHRLGIPDLELLRIVGWSGAPANAMRKVREAVDYVTVLRGGEGAFREFAEEFLLAGYL